MPCLPVELLDNIFDDAITLGILPVKTVVLVCHYAKLRYQKRMFKSVKLDPFDKDILNLDDLHHDHLIPHIEELRIVNRSNSSTLPSTKGDLPGLFTSFLRHAAYATSMIVRDPLIPWQHLSAETIDAFCTVFRRRSFRSLDVSVDNPLPSWMLLRGVDVASQLTVHSLGFIVPPPETTRLASYQCSLTHLVLSGNDAVKPVAKFCLHQKNLARDLLQNVVTLSLEYDQTYASIGPSVTPYAEMLLGFLAPQLEVLDLSVKSSDMPPFHISAPAVNNLKVLQHLTIRFAGRTLGYGDTLMFAKKYIQSFFTGLPSSSPVRSISLKVNDWRVNSPIYQSQYRRSLLQCIYGHLSRPENLPRLTSTDILIRVKDGSSIKSIDQTRYTHLRSNAILIASVFQVNVKAG